MLFLIAMCVYVSCVSLPQSEKLHNHVIGNNTGRLSQHGYLIITRVEEAGSNSYHSHTECGGAQIISSPSLQQDLQKLTWIPLSMDITVNTEIFGRVLFSRNFAYAKFRENKILAKWRNHSVDYEYS